MRKRDKNGKGMIDISFVEGTNAATLILRS
jgi:hypothetical protein